MYTVNFIYNEKVYSEILLVKKSYESLGWSLIALHSFLYVCNYFVYNKLSAFTKQAISWSRGYKSAIQVIIINTPEWTINNLIANYHIITLPFSVYCKRGYFSLGGNFAKMLVRHLTCG